MVAATRRATFADLDAMPNDGRRYELIDGEIFVSAAPSWIHQQVVGNLHLLLRAWVDPRSLGQIALAPVDILLSDSSAVQPDLVYASTPNLTKIRSGRYHGAPDLAVEVLSPTNREYDTVTKLFRYAQSGVREYWLIDPTYRTAQILSLIDGIYAPQKANEQGHYASIVLPGLMIDPEAIFIPVDPA